MFSLCFNRPSTWSKFKIELLQISCQPSKYWMKCLYGRLPLMFFRPASVWAAQLYIIFAMWRMKRVREGCRGLTMLASQSLSLALQYLFCSMAWLVIRCFVSVSFFLFFTCLNSLAPLGIKQLYMAVLGIACLCCFIATLMPKFDAPAYRKVRGIMYIVLGLSTASMFVMFTFMDEYITPLSTLAYAMGGYIYI